MEDMLSMGDMRSIFSVTDRFGIDRETVRVELTKEDPGSVNRREDGNLAIVAPRSTGVDRWLPALKAELESLGYMELEDDEDGEDE